MPRDHVIQLSRQRLIVTAHTDGDRVGKGERPVGAWGNGRDRQRVPRPLCEESGGRPPYEGGVDVAMVDGGDDLGQRTRLCIVAEDRVADHVLHEATVAQGVGRRTVAEVVADHLHADAEIAQTRVVE